MAWCVQGFNTQEKRWETLYYELDNAKCSTEYPSKHMAEVAANEYYRLWPGRYRVVTREESKTYEN